MKILIRNPQVQSILILLPLIMIYLFPFFKIKTGELLNSYPFISDDGYDWVTEGLYLKTFITSGNPNITLPVARPPVFNIVTMLDSFLWGNGVVIALANVIALLALVFYSSRIINQKNINFIIHLFFVLLLIYAPVNYVRFWLLSDSIAIFLGFFAFYNAYKLVIDNNLSIKNILITIISIIFAGLCQTYAMIPAGILLGIACLNFLTKKNYLSSLKLILLVSIAGIAYIATITSWFNFLPHKITPANFSLLQVNLNMLGFYFNTWGYYFLPLLPVSYLLLKNIQSLKFSLLITSLIIIILIHMLLAFFYQWPESRFSFLFWPYLVVLTLLLLDQIDFTKNKTSLYLSLLILIIQIFFTSIPNEWQPKLKELKYSDGIFVRYFKTQSLNRFNSHCCTSESICCNEYIVTDQHSPYVKATMEAYLKLKTK